MKTTLTIIGLTAGLCAGAGLAQAHSASGGNYAAPAQPIPYSQLNGYVSGSNPAATGSAADTSASTGLAPSTGSIDPNMPMAPNSQPGMASPGATGQMGTNPSSMNQPGAPSTMSPGSAGSTMPGSNSPAGASAPASPGGPH